jgi:hypothetical protein
MNWRRVICWLRGHSWEVVEGKRHCVACDHRPNDDGVVFCPKCGSERLMGNIMVSWGYQYTSCRDCDHKFQDTSDSEVTVTCSDGYFVLEKPVVDQDGEPIKEDEE